MEIPVQIVFHHVAHSPDLERFIRDKAARLRAMYPRLVRCHINLGRTHCHNLKGNPFQARIVLHVPGGELVVNRDGHEDVRVALHDAFDTARRQLEEHAQKARRQLKHQGSELTAGNQTGEGG